MQNTIIYNWETYTGGPGESIADRLYVTLNSRGYLLLNKNVFAAMGSPEKAMLAYDKRQKAIAVRPAGPKDEKPFPVTAHPKGSHRGIQAKPFCRYFQILPTQPIRFTDPQIDRHGTLILSLHHAEPVVPKPKKPRPD